MRCLAPACPSRSRSKRVSRLWPHCGLGPAGPGAFYPAAEAITVEDLIAGYRQLIARAREQGLTIQACTLPPMDLRVFR